MMGIAKDSVAWADSQLLRETVDENGKKINGNVPIVGLIRLSDDDDGDHEEVTARMNFFKVHWK